MRYFRCLIHSHARSHLRLPEKLVLKNRSRDEERVSQERRRLPQEVCRRICESRSRSFRKIIKGRYANLSRQLQDSNFQVQGHPLVGFGAAKNPCSFFVTSSSMIPKLARAREMANSRGTMSAAPPYTSRLTSHCPAALVMKLVKERNAENEKRARK
jgi:hypothetical protein